MMLEVQDSTVFRIRIRIRTPQTERGDHRDRLGLLVASVAVTP